MEKKEKQRERCAGPRRLGIFFLDFLCCSRHVFLHTRHVPQQTTRHYVRSYGTMCMACFLVYLGCKIFVSRLNNFRRAPSGLVVVICPSDFPVAPGFM